MNHSSWRESERGYTVRAPGGWLTIFWGQQSLAWKLVLDGQVEGPFPSLTAACDRADALLGWSPNRGAMRDVPPNLRHLSAEAYQRELAMEAQRRAAAAEQRARLERVRASMRGARQPAGAAQPFGAFGSPFGNAFGGTAPSPRPAAAAPGWRQVLGLGPTAGLAEARAAYRVLARQHHPDRGGDPATMAAVNAAWEEAQKALAGG